jgi:hypothetical protein
VGVENIRLRCGAHNRLEAEQFYGTPPGARDAGGARVDLARFPEFIRPGTGIRGESGPWDRGLELNAVREPSACST